MLGLIVSVIVFGLAGFFLNRYLEDWGLDKGKARTLLVLTLASLISYGAMYLFDRVTGQPGLLDTTTKLQQELQK